MRESKLVWCCGQVIFVFMQPKWGCLHFFGLGCLHFSSDNVNSCLWGYESLSSEDVKVSWCQDVKMSRCQDVKMSPVNARSLCAVLGLTCCTVIITTFKGRVKILFSIAPLVKNVGLKVTHYVIVTVRFYSKAMSPQYSCVCAGTVWWWQQLIMSGGSYTLTHSVRISKSELFTQLCVEIYCLVLWVAYKNIIFSSQCPGSCFKEFWLVDI